MGGGVGTAPCIRRLTIDHLRYHCMPITGLRVRVSSSVALPRFSAVAVATEHVAPPSPSPPPPSAISAEDTGPVELPGDQDPLGISSSVVSPLQSAASILLTGTIAVFLYRSLRRRAKLAKETKFRSSGSENVKELSEKDPVITTKPEAKTTSLPSALQTFQGAVIAGAIALVLYKFSTLVEASFASKPVSSVYTIRQLTITVRTIISGLCYLATFVFAANSIGLTLYSLQLLFNIVPTETLKEQDNQTVNNEEPLETESVDKVRKE